MTTIINPRLISFLKNFQVQKPWDDIIIFTLNVLITIIIFILIHQNFINLNWYFHIDRIIVFIILLIGIQLLLKLLRKITLIFTFILILILIYGSIFGNYGFASMSEDYRSLIYSMSDDPNPQDIILSKLLPFPNKSKILTAVDYSNPRVRNFALMATSKRFRNIKGFRKYRTTIQCFAVFAEIKDRWNYVNDPKRQEYIAKASESVQHFSGDCDDHAILMAACVRAVGGTPRIISTSNHYYPEMLIGTISDLENINFLIKKMLFTAEIKNNKLHYHLDEYNQVWLNLDYTARYPGGPFMSSEILGALTLY